MNQNAKWIRADQNIGSVSPEFVREADVRPGLKKATAKVSAMGVYNLLINGCKVGNAVLAPGAFSYPNRTLFQTYDITAYLTTGSNRISLLCGKGWAMSRFGNSGSRPNNFADTISVIADITLEYAGGETEYILTDTDWQCYTSAILDSELYHGETVDLTAPIRHIGSAAEDTAPKSRLEEQKHGMILEQERIGVREIIRTPKGETVLDFGQNLVGYAEIPVKGPHGSRIAVSHAEVLDRDGCFYTENMRSAKNLNTYVLSGGEDVSEYEELLGNIKKAFRENFMRDGLPVIYPKNEFVQPLCLRQCVRLDF